MNRQTRLRRTAAMIASVILAGGLVGAWAEDQPEWVAPARAARKTNPVPADDSSIAAGQELFTKNCFSCHGAGGKGNGPAAAALERPPGDLTSAKVQAQSDGALFWKITTGRKPMPSAPKELTEVQRWQIINYVRTFAPKPAGAQGGDSSK
jgi:mono/diheme cytochrome c family protein